MKYFFPYNAEGAKNLSPLPIGSSLRTAFQLVQVRRLKPESMFFYVTMWSKIKRLVSIRNLASRKFIGSKIHRHLEFWFSSVIGLPTH
ncbi:hypothetical protein C8N25_102263 [Algoriphagus antarcticus]|uniref:Uncharacterized protein n=1 Tax=Algoriphagus antarcticus TaxID=238540 RepID=A0A3E0E5G5_9BACT|nr:hypothetical protein C8N25_102263 [Algoriphagus antarcticus]